MMTCIIARLRDEITVPSGVSDCDATHASRADRPWDILDWNPNPTTSQPEVVPRYATQYPVWKRLSAQTRDIMQALP